jgi:beta-galactosidase beta subunit
VADLINGAVLSAQLNTMVNYELEVFSEEIEYVTRNDENQSVEYHRNIL